MHDWFFGPNPRQKLIFSWWKRMANAKSLDLLESPPSILDNFQNVKREIISMETFFWVHFHWFICGHDESIITEIGSKVPHHFFQKPFKAVEGIPKSFVRLQEFFPANQIDRGKAPFLQFFSICKHTIFDFATRCIAPEVGRVAKKGANSQKMKWTKIGQRKVI